MCYSMNKDDVYNSIDSIALNLSDLISDKLKSEKLISQDSTLTVNINISVHTNGTTKLTNGLVSLLPSNSKQHVQNKKSFKGRGLEQLLYLNDDDS